MTCRRICKKYHAGVIPRIGRYASGQKRCNECEIFMYVDGEQCPCCGTSLRSKPRSKKLKAQMGEYFIE